MPRNPLDIPCGGLPYMRDYNSIIRTKIKDQKEAQIITTQALSFYELLPHIRGFELPGLNVDDAFNYNKTLRIDYLLSRITEDKWKLKLQQAEKNRQRKRHRCLWCGGSMEIDTKQIYNLLKQTTEEVVELRKRIGILELNTGLSVESPLVKEYLGVELDKQKLLVEKET